MIKRVCHDCTQEVCFCAAEQQAMRGHLLACKPCDRALQRWPLSCLLPTDTGAKAKGEDARDER